MISEVEDYVTKCKRCGKTIMMRYSKNKNKWYPTEYGGGPADFHKCFSDNRVEKDKVSKEQIKKICPLLSIPAAKGILCQKEICAWWVSSEDRCVIKCLLTKH